MLEDKKDIAELLADESFINYCKKTSPEDIAFWQNYIEQNPERRVLVDMAREQFLALFNVLAESDLEEQVLRLKNRLNKKESAPVISIDDWKEEKKKNFFSLGRVMGAVAIVLVAIISVVWYTRSFGDKGIRAFTASYGERKNIQLPDGSVVNLNAGSKIEIDGSFGKSSRNVRLVGEAFFDVKHNESLPFIVQTSTMDVKALGTAFDVKAYQDEPNTETSLIRGLVEVTLKENNNSVLLLHPNQKIVWMRHSPTHNGSQGEALKKNSQPGERKIPQKLTVTDHGDIKEIAWKENKLVMEDDTFDDIVPLLERWYGVDIVFEDESIRNYRFTATFEKEGLQTVLGLLKESRNFNFKMDSGETLKVVLSR
jgi:transmembrane sensor